MKKKTRRGGQGKKGNKRNKVFRLSLLGTNAAGLKSKTESLFYLTWQLTFLKPTLNFIKFMKFMNL